MRGKWNGICGKIEVFFPTKGMKGAARSNPENDGRGKWSRQMVAANGRRKWSPQMVDLCRVVPCRDRPCRVATLSIKNDNPQTKHRHLLWISVKLHPQTALLCSKENKKRALAVKKLISLYPFYFNWLQRNINWERNNFQLSINFFCFIQKIYFTFAELFRVKDSIKQLLEWNVLRIVGWLIKRERINFLPFYLLVSDFLLIHTHTQELTRFCSHL